jgi:predicted PurR-regulated permease PerM
MTQQRLMFFWIGALAFFIAALYLFRDVILPFAAGLILAYLLDPFVDRLEKWKLPRIAGTLLVIGLFVVSFVVMLILILPVLGGQLTAFALKIPEYVVKLQALLANHDIEWLKTYTNGQLPDVSKNLSEIVTKALNWLLTFLQGVVATGSALLSVFSLLVVTPVVTFYLLLDWDKMVKAIDGWVPERGKKDVRQIATDVDKALSGFIRGQSLVCLFLGLFYGIGLTLAGLNFGFLIGLITGLISFIPYVGSLTGLVLALGVAIVQFWPQWTSIALVLFIFVAGQFIEGNILSPKLVGQSVGLHPVWLMFALFAFGALFGFVGLLLAVPLAAIMGVLARYSLKRYLMSPYYNDN